MAVKEESIYHPTEALLLKKPRKHYATSVSPIHWQLRSLISAEGRRYVYFPGRPGNTHIQRLDAATGEIDTVKQLTFSPRCLVAKNKWVCCGGENGEFTAIKVDSGDSAFGSDDDDDDARLSAHSIARVGRVAYRRKMGKERVNCVTLWFPPSSRGGAKMAELYPGAYDEPVAVLANNDKTVTLVSLAEWGATTTIDVADVDSDDDDPSSEGYCLDTLTYPDCVNRAVVSPDGRLLAAISDDPYLYIHERAPKFPQAMKFFQPKDKSDCQWKLCRKIYLKSQRREDRTNERGSFAVCFSNSGRYLAVGTQYGTISIFDATAFREPELDPFITAFASSRPNSEVGAVRDMAFCPGPFDMLAWTEDRGRIGMADLRRNFVSRQIITLDKDDGFEAVETREKGSGVIDPRLLENRAGRALPDRFDSFNLDDFLADVREGTTGGRAARSGGGGLASALRRAEPPARHQYPLTPEETEVLEALQDSRRRRETLTAAMAADATPSSWRLNPWPERRGGGGGGGGASSSSAAGTAGGTPTTTTARPRQRSASVTRVYVERDRERESAAAEHHQATGRERLEARLMQRAQILAEQGAAASRAAARASAAEATTLRGLRIGALGGRTSQAGGGAGGGGGGGGGGYEPGMTVEGAAQASPAGPWTRALLRFNAAGDDESGRAAAGSGATGAPTRPVTVVRPSAAWAELEALYDLSSYETGQDRGGVDGIGYVDMYSLINNSILNNAGDTPAPFDTLTRVQPPVMEAGAGGRHAGDFISPLFRQLGDRDWETGRRVGGGGGGVSVGRGGQDRLAGGGGGGGGVSGRVLDVVTGTPLPPTPEPDETAGLSWSDDGRVLFVGTGDGIYEFHVDVTARKSYPSITMR